MDEGRSLRSDDERQVKKDSSGLSVLQNFNPIDLVIEVAQCSFVEAVELLKKKSHLPV